jgi:flavin reductase (DIM6/NTAB) family NADH-FMN oxidoreductase RutF
MDPKALYKISYGLYVIGAKLDGRFAGCVVDAFIQSTSSPVPTVLLCSIQANQTNAAIKQNGEFTVSVLGRDVEPFVIGNFGFQSGRDADKWANVEHRLSDGLPILEKAVAYFRCKVTDQKELSTHTAFFCEVTDAWLGKGEPLLYADYQASMKAKTLEAFKAFKETGIAPSEAGRPRKSQSGSQNLRLRLRRRDALRAASRHLDLPRMRSSQERL